MRRNFFSLTSLTLIAFALVSCDTSVSEDMVVGTYVFDHTKYTSDTLRIFKNGTYEKRTYSNRDNSLIFVNKDTWQLDKDKSTIVLRDFFANQNNEFYSPNDGGLMTSFLPVERSILGNTSIYEGETYQGGDAYYNKL